MRSLKRRGIVASMEDEALAAQVAEIQEQVEQIGDNAESVETALVELTEMVGGQAEEDVQTETGEVVEEKLGDIAEVVEKSEENGGLTPEAAEVVEVAVEALCEVVGMAKPRVPSLESYGTTSSRLRSTKIALETLKETASKVWDAIVAAFKRAIEWIKQFFAKVFDVATKTKARAEKYKGLLAGGTFEPKDAEVKNDGLFKKLVVGSEVGDVKAELAKVKAFAAEVFARKDDLTKAADELSAKVGTGSLKGIAGEVGGILPKAMKSDVFPGNVVVEVSGSSDASGPDGVKVDALKNIKAGINSSGTEATAKPIKTLSHEAMKAVVAETSDLMDAILAYKKNVDAGDAAKKKLATVASTYGKAAKTASDADKKDLEAAKAVFQFLSKNLDKLPTAMAHYSAGLGKSALDLVELSMKSAKGKGKEEGEKKDESKKEETPAA